LATQALRNILVIGSQDLEETEGLPQLYTFVYVLFLCLLGHKFVEECESVGLHIAVAFELDRINKILKELKNIPKDDKNDIYDDTKGLGINGFISTLYSVML
jgi:hypothetical protein